jgi:hypothetical protein
MKEASIVRGARVWDSRAQAWVEIDLDVEIDLMGIAHQLAQKAYRNKKRRSAVMDGLISVAMRGTKVTPVELKP